MPLMVNTIQCHNVRQRVFRLRTCVFQNHSRHIAKCGYATHFLVFVVPCRVVQKKEADSRPPSGPQAGLVADAEAGRFLLMQLKGPETVAREDGKRLLHHLRQSFDREDERKASAAQRDAQWQAARFRKLLGGKV